MNRRDPLGLVDVTLAGEVYRTPAVVDPAHAHLYQGVDQGVHMLGEAGAKFFPQTGRTLSRNGGWDMASGKMLKDYARAFQSQPALQRAIARAQELANAARNSGSGGYITAGGAVLLGEGLLVAGAGGLGYYAGINDPLFQSSASWWGDVWTDVGIGLAIIEPLNASDGSRYRRLRVLSEQNWDSYRRQCD